MGIKGLMKLINEYEASICTPTCTLRGELIVDGYGVLHELYEKYSLDWANGGCYAQQHRATVEYFKAIVGAGVRPIVVVDGGGSEAQHDDTVYRRQKEMQKTPEHIQKWHEGTAVQHSSHAAAPHTLPIMAREVFVSSLKETGIDVYVADGKAIKTIVRISNYYHCPILTNNTYYCVCNVSGVVFFKKFDNVSCRAAIYEQTKLAAFLKISNPDLVYAIVAIIGDGSEKSVPFLYHGRIKANIEDHVTKCGDIRHRSWVLNVADFLAANKIQSFDDFKLTISNPKNFGGMWKRVLENCRRVEDVYINNYALRETLSIEELNASSSIECSKPCPLPSPVLQAYRRGTFPVLAVNAMTIGKCVLEQVVGDREQPPIPVLGRPVRELMYGIVSGLMNGGGRAKILEFHRTERNMEYDAHNAIPQCDHRELCIPNIYTMEEEFRKRLAVQAICNVLRCPENILTVCGSKRSLSLVTLATRRWAQHVIAREPMPNPRQLVKALVVNFFLNLSDPDKYRQPSIDKSKYSDPDWIKAYHALLEWQSLYRNVCSLNALLCQPLEMLSSSFLFDGPLVIFLALHPSPDIINTYASRMDDSKKTLYKQILDWVIAQ